MISPICFLSQYGNKLEMKINSFKYGHNILCWYPEGDFGHLQMTLLARDKILISDFEPNQTYCFFTLNAVKKMRSATVKIQTFHESIEEYLEKILLYTGKVEDDETVESWKKFVIYKNFFLDHELSMQNFLPNILMQKFFESLKSPAEKEIKTCCQIMQTLERYMNMQNIIMNRDAEIPLQIEYGSRLKLRFLYAIDKISVHSLRSGKKNFYRSYQIKNSDWLEFDIPPNEMYLISCFSKNDLIYKFYHYQFDENLSAFLWGTEKENFDKIELAMQNNILAGNISLELNEQELNFYLRETSVYPKNYIGSRPKFLNISQNKIYFYIDCWDFVKTSGKKFFLAAKEDDLLLTPNSENLVEIKSEIVEFNYAARLIDGNTLFYIADEKRNPVTKMTRHSFYSTDENILEEYNQKIYSIEFKKYEERLIKFIKREIPESLNLVKSFLIDIQSEGNIPTEKIWLELIKKINKTHQTFDKFLLFYAIMEEQSTGFNYDLSFFDNPISYYQQGDIFAFPTRPDPYVVVVMEMKKFSDEIKFEYFSPKNSTADIQTKKYDYYFMYAVDLKDYRRSGVIMFEKGKYRFDRIFKFNIEIKEVD